MDDSAAANTVRDEKRYQILVEHMAEGFVVCEAILDDEGKLTDYWVRAANPVFVERAVEGQVTIGRRQRAIRPSTGERWFEQCGRALAGQPVRFEFLDEPSSRWYEVHMMRLSDREFAQLFVDVTARKRAERRQAELFDELNHRVKNNLAVVASILELQARGSSAEVREHLAKAVHRIRSIGDLHSALHQQKGSDRVDVCSYLEDLRLRLSQALFEAGGVELRLSCEPIALPIGEAVNLGLIVNELVTNCAKHAFAGQGGEIDVVVSKAQDTVTVRVADNGRGFADGPDGLGLRVVRALADSMGGSVRILEGPGAVVEVQCRATAAAPASERQQSLL